jgi:hypothetical protein
MYIVWNFDKNVIWTTEKALVKYEFEHCGITIIFLLKSMEQSLSWEANSRPASQEILRLLWNPEVHYCVHKSPPLVHILRQM